MLDRIKQRIDSNFANRYISNRYTELDHARV